MKNKRGLAVFLSVTACILIIVTAIGVATIRQYSITDKLCDAIAENKTAEALELIEETKDVNMYTFSPFLLRPLTAVGINIRNPLVEACRAGDPVIVQALLEKGADPNTYLQGYWSPIEATFLKPKADRLEIARMLIAYGAEVDLSGSGDSALFRELQNMIYSQNRESFDPEAILLLLENGAAPIDGKGNTIMHYVCYAGDMELLEKLSEKYGEYLFLENQQGQAPLIWAMESGAEDVVDYLKGDGSKTD